MSEVILNRLKDFIIKQSAVDDDEITEYTQIENDLGVTGDDAIEFIIAYGKIFNVDVSRFMAADYFEGEGDKILPAIIRFLFGKKKKIRKILTVAHLEKGVVAGCLDEEIINE